MTTSVCCVIVYFDLAELYYTQRLQTTVADSVYPVFTVPFPSVAICLRNRIDWPRLHSSAAQRFLPPDADNETMHTFYRFFESLADIKFYSLHRLGHLFNGATKVNLSLIAGVDVLAVMEYLLFPCSEVFNSFCNWRFKSYNCCELFHVERTEMGFCYVFNSGISEKAKEKAVSVREIAIVLYLLPFMPMYLEKQCILSVSQFICRREQWLGTGSVT